jgi:hypothetical protein
VWVYNSTYKGFTVRNERGMEEAERRLKGQHWVYFSGSSTVEVCSKKAGASAAHGLRVDIGDWSGGETTLGGEILAEWSQPC